MVEGPGVNRQRGYIRFEKTEIVIFLSVIGFLGWGLIEIVLWFFSHISISWMW